MNASVPYINLRFVGHTRLRFLLVDIIFRFAIPNVDFIKIIAWLEQMKTEGERLQPPIA